MAFSARRTSYYLDVVKGERTGLGPSLLRAGLATAAYVVWLPASSASKYYKLHGPSKPWRAPCPVISVGNITAGGTGKTPMVEWLVNYLRSVHRRPAVLSRGYRATTGTSNDESELLSQHLGDVPVLTGKDRARSARGALEQKLANCFVLDDGFQHYAMERDLDIVLIDCLFPFGGGHLLPRGLLREPLRGLRRADAFVLTRSDQVDAVQRRAIRDKLAAIAGGGAPAAEAVHAPVDLAGVGPDGSACAEGLAWLRGRRVLLFSGIGNSLAFEGTAAALGCEAVERLRFRDHHRYFDHELVELGRRAEELRCDAALTTEKDLVKIGMCWKSQVPLWALRVRLQVTAGEADLCSLIDGALSRPEKLV